MAFLIPVPVILIIASILWIIYLQPIWQPVIIRARKAIHRAIIIRNSRRGTRLIRIR